MKVPGADPCPGSVGHHGGQLFRAIPVVVSQSQGSGKNLGAGIVGEVRIVGHLLPLAQEHAAPSGDFLVEAIEGDVRLGQVAQNADGVGLPHLRVVKGALHTADIQVVRVGQVGGGQIRRAAAQSG